MYLSGIEVKPGKPYSHQYNKDGGRLHISQATLSYGGSASTKRSVVQCNVGKSRPVLLCSLLPDKLETCPLDLEFQEDEEVIFSVLGPQSIYLTGYYLNLGHHRLNRYDDDTDSYGEDIAESETDPSRDSDENVYDTDDSFINDGDLEECSPSPQRKTKSRDDQSHISPRSTTGRKEKCNSRRKRLKKKYQVSDSEEDKDASKGRTTVKESVTVLNLDSEDEDKCLISSLFKSNNFDKNEKVENTSITKSAEDGKQAKAEEDGGRVTCSKRKIDTVVAERKLDQPCHLLLPSDDDSNRNSGKPKDKKKKKKEIIGQGKNLEDRMCIDQDQSIGNCSSDVHEENGQCKQIEIKNIGEELTIGNELQRKLPDNNMRVIDSHIIGNHGKAKKKKEKANKHKHLIPEEDDSKDLESKEAYIQIKELDPVNSATESNANLEDQKRVIDSLVSENSGTPKMKKKRKKGDKNEHMTTEDDDSKPLQLKEPFLENMKVNSIADVQESGVQPQDEKEKPKKKHKKKKGGDKDKATMTMDNVSEPLQSKDPCLERMGLDQPFDNDKKSNADLQNEKIHGLEVEKDENGRVKRKTKGKSKS